VGEVAHPLVEAGVEEEVGPLQVGEEQEERRQGVEVPGALYYQELAVLVEGVEGEEEEERLQVGVEQEGWRKSVEVMAVREAEEEVALHALSRL
jgi:hypothetical protein